MGFIMGGLDSEAYDREYGDLELVQRILHYFRPHTMAMVTASAAILASSLLAAAVPIIVARSLDLIVQDPAIRLVVLVAIGLLLLTSLEWVFNYIRQTHSARTIGDVVLKLREDVFTAVTQHDLSFYDEQPSGRVVSRVTSDTQDFASTAELTMNLLSQVLSVVVITAVALTVSVRLTLIVLVMTPVVFVIALSFRKVARKVTLNARRILAQVNANIQESVSGIAVAKAFRQEARMYDEFATLNARTYGVNLVRGLTLATIFPILSASFGIATAVILYFGGQAAWRGVTALNDTLAVGSITVGEWYLFMQAMSYFWFPMTSVASFWSQFQDGLSAAERVFALIDAEPQVVQTDNRPVLALTGEIAFRNVHLSYTGDDSVLRGFSLHVEPEEKLALVGHTGAGKTSIARLLGRFYEFQGGEILIDGQDIRTFDLAQYRRKLGFVPQSPFLFSGTVLDNIRYGRPEATDEEACAVAQQVAGDEWIQALPNGLQTDVGERGARLSMGQRQLVALARVLLHDPAILVLDEATASVDPFTEVQIQRGLERVMQGRTSLVIAHRLSTVRNADRIIVLRNGEIIEEGNHASLMARGGHYAELYETYFRHQSLEYIEQARALQEQHDSRVS